MYSSRYFGWCRFTMRFILPQLLRGFSQIDPGLKVDNLSLILVYQTHQTFFYCKRTYLVFGANVLCVLTKHFSPSTSLDYGGKSSILRQFLLLQSSEGVFGRPGPPALNAQSGAGPAGHLGRRNAHFLSSIDRRCQPY